MTSFESGDVFEMEVKGSRVDKKAALPWAGDEEKAGAKRRIYYSCGDF